MPTVTEGDLPAHRLAFEDARKLAAQIAPELELIYGFECDWYEGCEPLVERWSQDAVVRLGSVHWIGNPGDIMAGAAGTAGTANVAPTAAGSPNPIVPSPPDVMMLRLREYLK